MLAEVNIHNTDMLADMQTCNSGLFWLEDTSAHQQPGAEQTSV